MLGTKEKIFESAVKLFASRGYNGTSMRDLAKDVGIKESTLYYHYSNKEAMLDAIIEYYIEGFKASLPSQEEMKQTAMQFNDPVALWLHGAREFYTRQPLMMPIIAGILLNEMFFNEKCRKFVTHIMFTLQKESTEMLLGDMQQRGLIKECDIKKTAAQYVYMLHGLDIEIRLQIKEGKSKDEVYKDIFSNIEFFIETLRN